MSGFASRLIVWQRAHGRRDLPWQGADAYRVWFSEIMLQQTQVATVIPYYQRFIAAFPDIAALAAAGEEQVLAHWSGLGYYARGRNLHQAARIIVERFNGEFPRKFEDILDLPGIGRSTAAAICALAYHERRAILDGNVKRVLARYCGIEGRPDSKKVEEQLWQQAEMLLPDSSPRPAGEITSDLAVVVGQPSRMASSSIRVRERGGSDSDIAVYTQGLMDLGATVCTRSRPKCAVCPVQDDCVALATDRVNRLPAPRPRKPVPERHAVMLLLLHGNDILLEKRAPTGIWGGLWSLPQFDDEEAAMAWCAQRGIEVRHSGGGRNPAKQKKSCEALDTFTHTFTHFKLRITPLKVQLARKPLQAEQPGRVWLGAEDALGAAIPAPVRNLLLQLRSFAGRVSAALTNDLAVVF